MKNPGVTQHQPPTRAALLCFVLFFALTGCINSKMRATQVTANPTSGTVALTGDSYKITNVTMTSPTGGTPVPAPSGSPAGTVNQIQANIYFDTVQSTGPISNHCTSSTSATSPKPCQCVFTWSEVNSTSGTSITIPRSVYSAVSVVQPSLVSCTAPIAYSTEIPDGTTIKISVVPSPGSSESFTVNSYNFMKSASGSSGSFQDAQGRAFINVLRYSCYDQQSRGMDIISKLMTTSNGSSGEGSRPFPAANQFCVRKIADSSVAEGCETLPDPDYSSQASYFNLFIRANEVGDINPSNGRYVCPQVKEALGNTGTIGTQGKYWPLDSTFALSMGRTSDFPIGVNANTKVSNPSDPASAATDCDGAETGASSSNTLTRSCLGFAAKTNPDGTCPYIRDPSGTIRLTYRLRRYISVYPAIFDTDGKPVNQAQATDTIYVTDRPLSAATNPDPLKPYTMLGPKPCPFAYFDTRKVLEAVDSNTNKIPLYASTNDTRWSGKNVDGIEFPYRDTMTSCSAALPLLNSDRTIVTLGTVNAKNSSLSPLGTSMNRVFVRPITAWAPHYEEDLDFQACAPLSSEFRDPPLHFAKSATTGNVAWCAETYPTQNDHVEALTPHRSKLTVTNWPNGKSSDKVTIADHSDFSITESIVATYVWALTETGSPPPANGTATATAGTSRTLQTITAVYDQATDSFALTGSISGALGSTNAAPPYTYSDAVINFTATPTTIVAPPPADPFNPATPPTSFITGDTFTYVTTGNYFTVVSSESGISQNTTGLAGPPETYSINHAAAKFTITTGLTANSAAGSYNNGDKFIISVAPDPFGPNLPSVRPFTSHAVKNSASSDCNPTMPTLPSTYPAAGGFARHIAADQIDTSKVDGAADVAIGGDKSCDRTVINSNGAAWTRFPLLAPPLGVAAGAGIEEALTSTADTSYGCTVTYDGGGSKTDKKSPTQGCCGANVRVWTGVATAPNNANNAHLEPDATCLVPQY